MEKTEQDRTFKSFGTSMNTQYQIELKKLQEHYGIRATLNSFEQALWDKEGAMARLKPCYELWLRLEAARDILGADFAINIHKLLSAGLSAVQVISTLGSFENYVKRILLNNTQQIFDKNICSILQRSDKNWSFEY